MENKSKKYFFEITKQLFSSVKVKFKSIGCVLGSCSFLSRKYGGKINEMLEMIQISISEEISIVVSEEIQIFIPEKIQEIKFKSSRIGCVLGSRSFLSTEIWGEN